MIHSALIFGFHNFNLPLIIISHYENKFINIQFSLANFGRQSQINEIIIVRLYYFQTD